MLIDVLFVPITSDRAAQAFSRRKPARWEGIFFFRFIGTPSAATKVNHALTRRPGSRGFHEAEHRLLQLGIHLVGDGHHIEQHGAEIHAS